MAFPGDLITIYLALFVWERTWELYKIDLDKRVESACLVSQNARIVVNQSSIAMPLYVVLIAENRGLSSEYMRDYGVFLNI